MDAITRAVYRALPARIIAKTAPGWADVILVALRQDPAGRDAVIAALSVPSVPLKIHDR